MTKVFLYAKQGTILRWEYLSDKHNDFGLYTEGFYNCTIILLRNRNNGRIVLFHADITVSLDQLKQEIEWAGADCEKIIYHKDVPLAVETMDDLFENDNLKNSFDIRIIPKQYYKGKVIPDKSTPRLPDGSYVPEFEFDGIFFELNKITLSKQLPSNLFFFSNEKYINDIYQSFYTHTANMMPKRGNKFGLDDLTPEYKDQFTNSPQVLQVLYDAAMKGDGEKIINMLDCGADVNAQLDKYGHTMLHLAAAEGNVLLVALLIEKKANVNVQSEFNGTTPLFLAAGRGHADVVALLLKHCADLNISTVSGATPYEIAKRMNKTDICQLLTTPVKKQVQAESADLTSSNQNTTQKVYWIYTTTNKNAQAVNLINNAFEGTMEDKYPKRGINCYSEKLSAEAKLKEIFQTSSIKSGGPRKAFIFEFIAPINKFVVIFCAKISKQLDASQIQLPTPTSYVEYTYDREQSLLVVMSSSDTKNNENAANILNEGISKLRINQ